MRDNGNQPQKWRQCLEEGDLEGCLGRVILDVGYVFMFFWIAIAVILLVTGVWVAFIADPSITAPGSLNRDSSTAEKVAYLGFCAFLMAFGVVWLFVLRRLRRRMNGCSPHDAGTTSSAERGKQAE